MNMSERLLKRYIKLVVEGGKKDVLADDQSAEDESSVDEFAAVGGGAIQGYTAPLGASMPIPKVGKKRKKK